MLEIKNFSKEYSKGKKASPYKLYCRYLQNK